MTHGTTQEQVGDTIWFCRLDNCNARFVRETDLRRHQTMAHRGGTEPKYEAFVLEGIEILTYIPLAVVRTAIRHPHKCVHHAAWTELWTLEKMVPSSRPTLEVSLRISVICANLIQPVLRVLRNDISFLHSLFHALY